MLFRHDLSHALTEQKYESGDYFLAVARLWSAEPAGTPAVRGARLLAAVGADAAYFGAAYCDFYAGVFGYLAF